MDVADEIVVVNQGRVEQVGTPDELYDRPTNDFVMGFLGPVTRVDGRLLRPHDLEIVAEGLSGATPATVQRIVRLGFEVRVDLVSDEGELWIQMTRGEADRLELAVDRRVWVRPVVGAAMALP